MKSPRLNRKFVLEKQTQIPDGAGGFVEQWDTLGTLWADLSARTGRDRSEQGAPVSHVGYRIMVRSAPAGNLARPVPGQRLRDGERIYAIRAVAEEDPEGRYLTCFADEEVAV
jgi:SPP1 family predicted phage head-tail adaptor